MTDRPENPLQKAPLTLWYTRAVRQYFYELLSLLLFVGSMVFFYECVRFLSRRDYIAAMILMLIGLAVIRVGSELARLAMIDRRQ